jgi:autotransporter-associated beta strand protein
MSASSDGYTLANLVEMWQDTTISGTGSLNFSGNFVLKGSNHTLTIDNSAPTTFSGASITTDADQTLTYNVTSGSGGATVSGVMQNSGNSILAITKTGGGTLTLSGNNTYTGRTTISGGTLMLASANRIADASPMTLSGGTFNTGGFNETVGALTLTANSVINLGFSSGTLRFAASNGLFTSSTTLSIYNWTSGSDHLFFGTNNSSLDSGQLGQISFYSDSGGNFLGTGTFTGTQGELVPIPEPTAVAVALGVLGLIGWRERRRIRRRFEPAHCAFD